MTANRKAQLEDAATGYARALRNGDEAVLSAFVHPDQQNDFSKNSRKLTGVMFSDVEIRKIYPDPQLNSAVVTMNLEYFAQSGSQLFSAVRQFNWSYDEKNKAWLLKETTPFGSN